MVVPLEVLSGSTARRAVVPLVSSFFRLLVSVRDFGAEMDDFAVKIRWILWMERGDTWGDARSTRNQANPWIKINKTSLNQQITKNLGLFLVGIFEI